jgi:broad specificity phosphatase PhoE
LDSELTDFGKDQSAKLGGYLLDKEIDYVFCSPMTRARQTFEQIVPYLKKSVQIRYTKKLSERKLGVYSEGDYDDWSRFFRDANQKNMDVRYFKPENGESLQEVYDRAGIFYRYLLKIFPRSNLLLIGHQCLSLCLILNILGRDVSEENFFQIDNASISFFDIEDNILKEYRINYTGYLK